MDTPKPLQQSAHLLDDLESIRQLLGDDNLQPPLLTDTVEEGDQEQIPMLFDAVGEPSPPVVSTAPPPSLNLSPRRHRRLPPARTRMTCCTWTANCAPPRN